MPKAEYSAGAHACIAICSKVTNEAITTINAGIRTICGTMFFIAEIAAFEHVSTAIVAKPIERPVNADDVVPRVGHMPKTRTKVGFCLIRPSRNVVIAFIVYRR